MTRSRRFSKWVSKALDYFTNSDDFPPVFLLWGDENRVLPLSTGEAFCYRSLPDRFEVVEKCGHLVMREKPDVVSTWMDLFLQMDLRKSEPPVRVAL